MVTHAEAVIWADGLTKTFRGRRSTGVEAVSGLSLSVGAGERVAYIGPNGAGKSTSIKMLTGILHPTTGRAEVLGHVPWTQRRALTRRIGTLFGQRSQLWFELTPRQSYRMLAAIYRLDEGAEERRLAELGGLLDASDLFDMPVRSLSLGQRMRCELAACLLHDPQIVFLDEPTIGLDLLAKQRFRQLLVRLNEEKGTTVFLTSHDVADIEHVAQRVIVINHGQVIYDNTVASMRRSLLATKLVEVTFDRPPDNLEMAGVTVVTADATSLRLAVDTTITPVRKVVDVLLERADIGDLSIVDPPLEQVIANIYEQAARP
ncbi:MAG TPA: ATP-binding cassette domain-containing protein [Acidimicrobiales bacterium]|nr:ATP-binding cassette domain-containing protein [Acidimicrobiales bacterium]